MIIANINQQYFAGSESFIYWYLTHLQKYQTRCYCWYPVINLDKFPYPQDDIKSIYNVPSPFPRKLRSFLKKGFGVFLDRKVLMPEFEKVQFSAIHAHYGPVGWWALEIKRKTHLPLITTFYGYDLSPNLQGEIPGWNRKRKLLFELGDLFLVEGPHMRDRLMDYGCPKEKIGIQHIAIPVEIIPFRFPKMNRKRKSVLIFAGRFIEKKGLMDAVQAVHRATEHGLDLELRLIGDGPLRKKAEQYVRQNGLEKLIRFLGFLDHPAYLAQMDLADIFIHPSCTTEDGDTEGGAPTTILEAEAIGLPIISTWHADIPYVLEPGQNSILVNEHDIEGLVKAIVEMVSHPERWEQMAILGRNKVERNHDIRFEVLNLEQKYNEIINQVGS